MQPVSSRGDADGSVDQFLAAVEPSMPLGTDAFLTSWTRQWCQIGGAHYAAVYWQTAAGGRMVTSCGVGQTLPKGLDADWFRQAYRQAVDEPLILHPDVGHPLLPTDGKQLLLIRSLPADGELEEGSSRDTWISTVVALDALTPHQHLHWLWESSLAILVEFAKSAERDHLSRKASSLSRFEHLLSRLYAQEGSRSVANLVAHAGARWLGCDRVMVVQQHRRGWKVLAVTGVQRIDSRGDLCRATTRLASVAAKYGEAFAGEDTELPPQVEGPLQAWIDISHLEYVRVLPGRSSPALDEDAQLDREPSPRSLSGEALREDSRCIVIVANFNESLPPLSLSQRLADHTALALDRERHWESIPGGRWLRRWRGNGQPSAKRGLRWLTAIVVLSMLVGLLWIPVPFSIGLSGVLQPAERRIIYAPTDGVVEQVEIDHGDEVARQQTLLTIRRNALDFDLARLEGQRDNLLTELDSLEKAGLIAAVAGDSQSQDGADIAAQQRRVEKELEGLQRQIEIARDESQHLTLKAPLAGVVVTRDARLELSDRPVATGDELLVVAKLTGAWHLELLCPEEDIQLIRASRDQCQFSFATISSPQQKWPADLVDIDRIAHREKDERTYVSLLAAVDAETSRRGDWVPGMRVQTRVHLGDRPLGYVLTRRMWHQLRYQFLW